MGQTSSNQRHTASTRAAAAQGRHQTGEELRRLAFEADGQRRSYSDRSQNAWLAGRRAEAAQLSDMSKQFAAEQNRLHSLAAESFFAENNPHYPLLGSDHGRRRRRRRQRRRGFLARWLFGNCGGGGGSGGNASAQDGGLKEVDLHGLLVVEALEKTKEHLAACRERRVRRTKIITGRGNHSVGGVARLRPEVEAWLRERSGELRIVPGRNDGAIDVELLDGGGWARGFLSLLGW